MSIRVSTEYTRRLIIISYDHRHVRANGVDNDGSTYEDLGTSLSIRAQLGVGCLVLNITNT